MTEIGQPVWTPDSELAWAQGTVISAKGGTRYDIKITDPNSGSRGQTLSIDLASKEFTDIKMDKLPLMNLGLTDTGVEDMTVLDYLHEPAVLHNLSNRFFRERPYTYSGDIVIAVNPYKWLTSLYTEQMQTAYLNQEKESLPAHCYGASAGSFRNLKKQGQNQTLLVSGDSGAGKTETVKIMMRHLAFASTKSAGGDTKDIESNPVIKKVLDSNPLLESFGNAMTIRNDNSSRFGKFTQMQFATGFTLVGSKAVTYLLEKSRVVSQAPNERSYHIFYQVLAAPGGVKQEMDLGKHDVNDFDYISMGNVGHTKIQGESDSEMFNRTYKALGLFGVVGDTQKTMFHVISGILKTGNITFSQGREEDSSQVESRADLNDACKLLGLDPDGVAFNITSRVMLVNKEKITIPLRPNEADEARDAMSKEVYTRLFLWLVGQINKTTAYNGSETPRTISLLDIFGFESFAVNRFEQLCINYANEKLQQKFTQDVLSLVQIEYEEEGINWKGIEFEDNIGCVELIEGGVGIINILKEESSLQNGNDSTFLSKMVNIFSGSEPNPYFMVDRLNSGTNFVVRHYAGDVSYAIDGMVDRNKDNLPDGLTEVIQKSSNELVRLFFDPDANLEGFDKRPRRRGRFGAETVSSKFRNQMMQLMDSMSDTKVRYVRCIKPNAHKSSNEFDRLSVVQQLRSAGVLEAIRIARSGYPNRLPHDDFVYRFKILVPNGKNLYPEDGGQKVCKELADKLLPDKSQFQVGKTRIYFRPNVLEELEEARGRVLEEYIVRIQTFFRSILPRIRFLRMRKAAYKVQGIWKMFMARSIYLYTRQCAIKVQAEWRAYKARRIYDDMAESAGADKIQSILKMRREKKAFEMKRDAANKIKGFLKTTKVKKEYAEYKKEMQEFKEIVSKATASKELLAKLKEAEPGEDGKVSVDGDAIASVEETIEALNSEITKLRQQNTEIRSENRSLREENSRLQNQVGMSQDVYQAMSRTALESDEANQRARVRERTAGKAYIQADRYKMEGKTLQEQVEAERELRVTQQRLLSGMINLLEARGVDGEIVATFKSQYNDMMAMAGQVEAAGRPPAPGEKMPTPLQLRVGRSSVRYSGGGGGPRPSDMSDLDLKSDSSPAKSAPKNPPKDASKGSEKKSAPAKRGRRGQNKPPPKEAPKPAPKAPPKPPAKSAPDAGSKGKKSKKSKKDSSSKSKASPSRGGGGGGGGRMGPGGVYLPPGLTDRIGTPSSRNAPSPPPLPPRQGATEESSASTASSVSGGPGGYGGRSTARTGRRKARAMEKKDKKEQKRRAAAAKVPARPKKGGLFRLW